MSTIADYRKDFVITETMTFVVDPIVAFPEVEKLLYEVAWEYAKRYPISFEECKSTAYAAFLKACTDYKGQRGMKFSTWARYWAWCKLKDLVMKRSGERVSFVDEVGEEMLEAQPTETPSLELVAELGDDARTIVRLFLETPADILEGCTTARLLVRSVKRFLVKERRWKPQRFEDAFHTVRVCLNKGWS